MSAARSYHYDASNFHGVPDHVREDPDFMRRLADLHDEKEAEAARGDGFAGGSPYVAETVAEQVVKTELTRALRLYKAPAEGEAGSRALDWSRLQARTLHTGPMGAYGYAARLAGSPDGYGEDGTYYVATLAALCCGWGSRYRAEDADVADRLYEAVSGLYVVYSVPAVKRAEVEA